jgi:CHAT domain-containing protein
MDEQRMQAYVGLIEQLLGCAQGAEDALLQANAELVDAGLVVVMGLVADQMESEGNGNAGWLRQFTAQLEQAWGLAPYSPSSSSSGDTAGFVIEIVQLITQTHGNYTQMYAQIYDFFRTNVGQLDEMLLRALPSVFEDLIQQNDQFWIAVVFSEFGNLIQQFPLGTRWLNLELSIIAYQLALQVFTRDAFPEQRAGTQSNLAHAYSDRIRGERVDNLEQAISIYESALHVLTYDSFPEQWATIQNNLASAYTDRIRGNRADNLEHAIAAYELALQIRNYKTFPEDWAATQNNLALAYTERIRGERADNLEYAIAAFKSVLQVYTYENFPEEWAMTYNNLGIAYVSRVRGKRVDNLEKAITAYELALRVRTRDDFPEQWAQTNNNIAIAYNNRIRGERANNLDWAIDAYKSALQIYTRDNFPEQWATTQNNLATAYLFRVRGARADNLEQAITASRLALQVYTRDFFPSDWAMTQNNLANAYVYRILGNQADNLEEAITASRLALQVYTRCTFPEQWAIAQNNLAIAYRNRIRGDHADNLEQAIDAYELALQVRTRDAFPEQWATTQNNLATTYLYRIRGDRTDNLERAIATYELALQIITRNAFPEQWATTQNNLGLAYANRIRGLHADNIEQAIDAYELALQIISIDAFPEQWATTQNNLGLAYASRIRGERADNLERAITAYKLSLRVYTQKSFPGDWAMTQNNLGLAYSNRIHGDHANNLERAIAIYKIVLRVYTYDAFPEQSARTHSNLADAYTKRVKRDHAKNIEKAIATYRLALQVLSYEQFPKECRQTSRSLGDLYFSQKNWEAAIIAYNNALTATEMLYQSCVLLDSKTFELTETADLPRFNAYALARVDDLKTSIATLEKYRARSLSETLDRDRTNLENLKDKTLYSQYKDLTNQIRSLETQQRDRMMSDDRHSITPEALRDTATSLRQQLTTNLDQIRQQAGYETFLTLPNFEDVQKAATLNTPLIYLLTTPAGSLALIVTPITTDHLWLDNFTETQLTDFLEAWFADYNNAQQDHQAWYDTIEETTQKLWEPIMGPLVQKLQELNHDHITLIPTGYLSLLPLHAAWTKDESKPTKRRYAFDEIHITYAPNAKSLTAAQVIADRTQSDSILAIDDPSEDLNNSDREVQAAIASFLPHATLLRHDHATTTAVKTSLPQAAIAHFSCHGTANLNEPLNSGLAMNDGLLTLKDIFALNLAESGGLRLAILSACETGIQGLDNADEAISLPTGLLQAGVAAVISSLWSVDDRSTRILLTRFYDLWRKEHLEPSVALRQAQLWVRDTSSQQKAKYFQATHPDLFQSLILLPPDYFAHPFHWAAFSYTGV